MNGERWPDWEALEAAFDGIDLSALTQPFDPDVLDALPMELQVRLARIEVRAWYGYHRTMRNRARRARKATR